MTGPVAPILIDPAPEVPTSAAPEAEFDVAYENFNKWEHDKLQPQANALAQNVYDNTLLAYGASNTAQQAAVDASGAAELALASSNFKGLWATLAALPSPASRQLSKPACVAHVNDFWMLLNDLVDVATSEPGVSGDWVRIPSDIRPTQLITGNTTAIPGVRYLFGANGVVLTLAAAYTKGQYQGWRLLSGFTGCAVDFGAHKYMGLTVGVVQLDVPLYPMDLNYENASVGLQ